MDPYLRIQSQGHDPWHLSRGGSLGYLESYLIEFNWRFNMRTKSKIQDSLFEFIRLLFETPVKTRNQLKINVQTS